MSISLSFAQVDKSVTEPLRDIFALTLAAYPKLTGVLQTSCGSAIIQFIYSICAMKRRPVRLLSNISECLLFTDQDISVNNDLSAP